MFWCLSAGNGHNEIDDFIAKSIPGACRLKWAQRKEGFHDQIDFKGLSIEIEYILRNNLFEQN